MRAIIVPLLLALALPAFAFDWEYLGMDGINATTLTIDSERDRVFVGTYEGFWYFDQVGAMWTERDEEGWIGRTVWAVDFHDDLPDRVITGRENGWFKGYMEYSDDLGLTGNFVYESTGGRVTDALHLGAHNWACTASDIAPGELLHSSDGGESWSPIAGHGFYAMTDMCLDPSGTLYLVGSLTGVAGVKRSRDFGLTWESIVGDLPPEYGIYCVEYASPGGDVITEPSIFVSNDLGLYYSEVAGTWEQMLDASCRRVVSIPGQSWAAPDDVAVVTWDGRVLYSSDFGESWMDETGNLPGTPIDMALDPIDMALYVLTSDQGLYRFSNLTTSVETPPAAEMALGAHPNPFNPETTLHFKLPQAGRSRLSIFDASGRRVATVFDEVRPAGEQSAVWRAEGLPSGVYLAHLQTGEISISSRLVLIK